MPPNVRRGRSGRYRNLPLPPSGDSPGAGPGTRREGSFAQREMERCALARGLGPGPAAMAAHDALHRREADPRALEVLLGMQAVERREEALRMRGVEARPVVADEVCP